MNFGYDLYLPRIFPIYLYHKKVASVDYFKSYFSIFMEVIVISDYKKKTHLKAILACDQKMNFIFVYHVYIFTCRINYKKKKHRSYAKRQTLCIAVCTHCNSAWCLDWFYSLSPNDFDYYHENMLWTLTIFQNNTLYLYMTTNNQMFTFGCIHFQIRRIYRSHPKSGYRFILYMRGDTSGI